MLTAEQLAEFSELGVVKLRAFSSADATRMQEAVWAELWRKHGMRRDDPASWGSGNAYGLERIKEAPTFVPVAGCRAAIDDLLGAGSWDLPKRWGAFLVTFPTDREWNVPYAVWHADFSYALPPEPLSGVKMFVFLSDVPTRAGGTLVVSGSHHVIQQFIKGRSREQLENTRRIRLELLGSHSWLQDLTSRSPSQDRVMRFLDRGSMIDGIPVQVVELTGEAGEVVLTHPWVLHCRAPNCGKAPRFMRTIDIYRREVHPMVFPFHRSTRN